MIPIYTSVISISQVSSFKEMNKSNLIINCRLLYNIHIKIALILLIGSVNTIYLHLKENNSF